MVAAMALSVTGLPNGEVETLNVGLGEPLGNPGVEVGGYSGGGQLQKSRRAQAVPEAAAVRNGEAKIGGLDRHASHHAVTDVGGVTAYRGLGAGWMRGI